METKTTMQRINNTMSWLSEKINKTDKLFAKLTKERRPKLINLETNKGTLQQIPMKSRGSLGNIVKIYIPIS
jgi:hypothetical protein